jgi:hypothetical protein
MVSACNEPTPPYDKTWISPGKVEIDNYYSGCQAEWNLTIHNGNVKDYVDTKMVNTSAGKTEALIPLKARLHGDLNGIKITSSINEDLVAKSYITENQSLLISGFKPDITRQLTLTYPRYTEYSLYCRAPDNPIEGYTGVFNTEWIVISDQSPVMGPGETRDIMVALNTTKDTQLPDNKWEFWIGVKEIGSESTITIELCSRWLVTMK